jgi:hypothetical protein
MTLEIFSLTEGNCLRLNYIRDKQQQQQQTTTANNKDQPLTSGRQTIF